MRAKTPITAQRRARDDGASAPSAARRRRWRQRTGRGFRRDAAASSAESAAWASRAHVALSALPPEEPAGATIAEAAGREAAFAFRGPVRRRPAMPWPRFSSSPRPPRVGLPSRSRGRGAPVAETQRMGGGRMADLGARMFGAFSRRCVCWLLCSGVVVDWFADDESSLQRRGRGRARPQKGRREVWLARRRRRCSIDEATPPNVNHHTKHFPLLWSSAPYCARDVSYNQRSPPRRARIAPRLLRPVPLPLSPPPAPEASSRSHV